MKVTIYGRSDDLVEVEGDIEEEFGGDDVLLMFGDGTHIRARYDNDGLWRLACEKEGAAKVVSAFVATDSDGDDYSDRMTLEGDLVSVEKWLSPREVIDALTDWDWRQYGDEALREIHAFVRSRAKDGR